MVEAARRRSADLGLTNVEYRVMDAERVDLPDGSVDGVICFSVFASAERNPWAAMPARVLIEGAT